MALFNYDPELFVNAVRQGDLEKVRDMLSERFYRYAECIDIDSREHVLILAVLTGCTDIVKALVAAKTNINVKSNNGQSVMDIATNPSMVKYLKELYAPETAGKESDETMPKTPDAGTPWRQVSGMSIYDAALPKSEATEEAEEEPEPEEKSEEPEEAEEKSEEPEAEEAEMVPNPDASKALMDMLHVPTKILELKFAPDNNMFMPIPVNVTKDVPGIHLKVMVRNEGVPPMLMNAVVLNNMYYVIVEAIEDSILVRKLHPCIPV